MASDFGFDLDGKEVVIPGAYARNTVDAFTRRRNPILRRLAILAPAFGGRPQAFTALSSPAQAAQLLKDGPGLDLADLAFKGGVGEILFYRINAAVAATASFGDLTVTARPEFAGLFGNNIRIRRDTPSDASARVLTVEYPGDGLGAEVSPPLGPALEITYTGTGTSPSVSVSTTAGQKTLSLTGDTPAENHSLPLGGVGAKTFAELAALINGFSGWTAKVLYEHDRYNPGDLPDGPLTLTANKTVLNLGVKAQAAWLAASRYVSGTAGTGSESNTDAGWVYLSGGSEGPAVTATDYQAAFSALENQDVQAVVVGTTDPAVHAMGAAHADAMSHPKARKERVFFCGPALASTLSQSITDALSLSTALSSENAVVVPTPSLRRNPRSGTLETLGPNFTAALVAGMWCGLKPNQSLTYAVAPVLGLGFEYKDEHIEALLKGGTTPLFYDLEDAAYRIAQGVTTTRERNNSMRRLLSGVGIRAYLNRGIRQATKKFVGTSGDATTVESILNAVKGFLQREADPNNREGVLTPGVDANGVPHAGFRNVQAVFDTASNLVGITFEAFTRGEIGYILASASLEPTKIVAS